MNSLVTGMLGASALQTAWLLGRNGGSGRNRTGVDGFAIRCITTLPPSLVVAANEPQR